MDAAHPCLRDFLPLLVENLFHRRSLIEEKQLKHQDVGNTLICPWQRENWRGKLLAENNHQHGGKSGSFSRPSA